MRNHIGRPEGFFRGRFFQRVRFYIFGGKTKYKSHQTHKVNAETYLKSNIIKAHFSLSKIWVGFSVPSVGLFVIYSGLTSIYVKLNR